MYRDNFSRGHFLSDVASSRQSRSLTRSYQEKEEEVRRKRLIERVVSVLGGTALVLVSVLTLVLSLLLF